MAGRTRADAPARRLGLDRVRRRASSRCSRATWRRAGRCSTGRPRWPRPRGDANLAAHVTDARGILAFNSGDLAAAQAEYEAALAVYQRDGFSDPAALVTYGRLASVCLLAFELDAGGRACARSACAAATSIGEQWARGTALWVRGAARWLSGDNAAAIEDALACLRIKDELGDLHTTAMSFDLLSVCLVATARLRAGGRAATGRATRCGRCCAPRC